MMTPDGIGITDDSPVPVQLKCAFKRTDNDANQYITRDKQQNRTSIFTNILLYLQVTTIFTNTGNHRVVLHSRGSYLVYRGVQLVSNREYVTAEIITSKLFFLKLRFTECLKTPSVCSTKIVISIYHFPSHVMNCVRGRL